MTARSVYAASVASAENAFVNNPASAQFPGTNAANATFNLAVANGTDPRVAYKAYVATVQAAAMNAQVAESMAKDVLKSTGDTFPT